MSSPEQPTPVARPKEGSYSQEAVCHVMVVSTGMILFIIGVADVLSATKIGFWLMLAGGLVLIGLFGMLDAHPNAKVFWEYINYLTQKNAADKAADNARYDELLAKHEALLEYTEDYRVARGIAEAQANREVIAELVRRNLGDTTPPPDDKPTS